MGRIRLLVAWRAVLQALLYLGGILRPRLQSRRAPRRKRLAFQAYSAHLAQGFAPVIAKLQQEAPDLELHFLILPHPHFSFRSLWALRDFARDALHVPGPNVRFFWQVLWQRYDLLVCTDVYASFPLRRTRRVLLNHGAGVASRFLEPHPLRKTVFDFDLVLVSGEADLELLRRVCPEEFVAEKVVATGQPYLDRLYARGDSRAAYLRGLGLDDREPVVLVAPSWRGAQAIDERQPRSFDALIAALGRLDVQTIIKMHACSFNKAMVRGEDWEARVRAHAQDRVRVDNDIDDISALRHADLLITDISSRAFNFMLLDKPVVAFCPDEVFVDPLDRERIELIRRGAYLARSVAEVEAVLEPALRGRALADPERAQVGRYCFANPGGATDAVVAQLLRHIRGGA